eukprot:1615179-Pyramimonas_sp.AAC.1
MEAARGAGTGGRSIDDMLCLSGSILAIECLNRAQLGQRRRLARRPRRRLLARPPLRIAENASPGQARVFLGPDPDLAPARAR